VYDEKMYGDEVDHLIRGLAEDQSSRLFVITRMAALLLHQLLLLGIRTCSVLQHSS